MAEATAAQKACRHEDFAAVVGVNRMEDTGRFLAEITIRCTRCNLSFTFVGVAAGLAWDRPTCSIDSTTLNAPIAPEYLQQLHAGACYQVPPELSQPKH